MKKYMLAAAALILATAWCLYIRSAPPGDTVEVVQHGKVIMRLDLGTSADERRLTIDDGHGGTNTLLIRDGRIRVESANCPGHDCVKMGWLKSRLPLVCLPHGLTVRFAGGTAPKLDSISQ